MTNQPEQRPAMKGSKPVLLSSDEAGEVARLLKILLDNQEAHYDSTSAAPADGEPLPDKVRLRNLARQIYLGRRARAGFFSRGLDGEPAWDMLLALYVRDTNNAAHTTSQVTEFSAAAPSTALRWIDYLCDQGLVAKEPSPIDRRLTLVRLTAKARAHLDSYLTLLAQNGLGH